MVRTDTSSSVASAAPVVRPLACNSRTSARSRSARTSRTLPWVADTRCQLYGRTVLSMAITTVDSLAFYRAAGPMTAIDENRHGPALEGLATEPASLARAVRRGLIHR